MKLRALLELMRVSNLPTVWSNAWMGVMAGLYVQRYRASSRCMMADYLDTPPNTWLAVVLLGLGMSLIYCGGMAMNDAADRKIDLAERPNRPIPAGRVAPGFAWVLSLVMLGLGLALVVLTEGLVPAPESWWADGAWLGLALVGCVIAYNMSHRFTAWSVVLMAGCRALTILACASAVMRHTWFFDDRIGLLWVALPACVLMLYTLAISVVARREVDPERGGFGGPKTIMNMIAAMPLLDALWLVLIGLWPASLVCVGCAVLTKLGHRRIAGS